MVGFDGGAGTQFGRENEPHICVKQYSSGPDTKKERKKENRVKKYQAVQVRSAVSTINILSPDMTLYNSLCFLCSR